MQSAKPGCALFCIRCPRKRAEEVATTVLAAIEEFTLHWEGGKFFRVGASSGVAYTNAGEHDAAAVLRAVDSAWYAANNNGRNRIEVYHADRPNEASGRFNLIALQRAAKGHGAIREPSLVANPVFQARFPGPIPGPMRRVDR